MTLTTVGYGDVYPRTPSGQMLGALCVMSGLVVVAYPISIISSALDKVTAEYEDAQKLVARREHYLHLLGMKRPGSFYIPPEPVAVVPSRRASKSSLPGESGLMQRRDSTQDSTGTGNTC